LRLALAGLLALLLGYPALLTVRVTGTLAVDSDLMRLLTWLEPRSDGSRAVLAPMEYGHAVRYYAKAPVLTTPFGTDIGSDGLQDFAAFAYAPTPEVAEDVLRRRGVGWLLFGDPLGPVASAHAFARPGTPPLTRVEETAEGRRVRSLPEYLRGVVSWLYDFDGVPEQFVDREAIGWARLVYETKDRGSLPFKLFEFVPGARIEVRGPEAGQRVTGAMRIASNQGRRFLWWTVAHADRNGRAVLRVPYASGANGAVLADPLTVEAGSRRDVVRVPEDAVASGMGVSIDLASGASGER
jgi:hypothetical protein